MADQTEVQAEGLGGTMPKEEELLERLKSSVEDVFQTLVISFREAASQGAENGIALEGDNGVLEHVDIEQQYGVDFTGALSGTVAVRCSADGAMDIARGLLMLEDGDTLEADEIADALGECANMLTGSLKTTALDPLGEFELGLPYAVTDWQSDGRAVAYRLTEGAVSIEIRMRDAGAANT